MKLAAAALLAFGVAACNSQTGGTNNQMAASAPPVAAAGPAAPADQAATLRPGRWEMTMRVVSLEMPNAPPELAAQLRNQPLPRPQVRANCVTPEEAADLIGDFRRQIVQNQPNASCQPQEQVFSGGRIRVSMTCGGAGGQGGEQRIAMVGGFTADALQMAVSVDSVTPVGNGMAPRAVRLQSTFTGRRVGECNGTETP